MRGEESTKSFPPDVGCEGSRKPSDDGRKLWNIENLALASALDGTTKGRSCPHCDSTTLESRSRIVPHGKVILSSSVA